jgi:4-amino-4-deoxy-L-arabinose transferase-like glycosyltransferase
MPRARVFSLVDLLVLAGVLALAGGSRAWYIMNCAGDGGTAAPVRVQTDAGDPARAQAGPPSTFPDPYPWLVGQLDAVWADAAARTQAVRWIQCGLGALTAALYFLFIWWAFESRLVGVLTGVLCALHPFWIVNTAELGDGVLATFLLSACIFLGSLGGESGGALTSYLYGLGLAGLALLRAALLPFALVAVLWFLLRSRAHQRGWLYALLAVLGLGTGLAPWAASVYRHPGEAFFLVHETYVHLWQGNNPAATGGPMPADARGGWDKSNRELATAMWQEVQDNPLDTVRRRITAEIGFFVGAEWFQSRQLWHDASTATNMPAWLQNSHGTLLSGALLGMIALGVLGWRWSYPWRREAMPSSLAVLWIPLPYILSHASQLQGPRLPLDGIFLCYTAVVLACVSPPVARWLLRGPDGGRAGWAE